MVYGIEGVWYLMESGPTNMKEHMRHFIHKHEYVLTRKCFDPLLLTAGRAEHRK